MKINYKLRKVVFSALAGLGGLSMQAQQSYTFTNCSATGSVGPTQAQVNAAYLSTNLNAQVQTTISGIQTWTVPYTGGFRIEARGAQGGSSTNAGGLGATMIGDFTLTAGEVIRILVGQMGENGGSGPGGGGGGSFVVRSPYTSTVNAILVAGGGAGDGNYSNAPGLTTTSGGMGGVAGGTNGQGGGGGTRGGGGGGFLTDGGPCTVNTIYASPGQAFVNGGRGGPWTNNTTCNFTANGGFGGGSSHGGNCINNGGAGGGFSGGGGSSNSVSGGGGSINQGTNQSNTQGNNAGHGRVIITELCSVRIFASGSNSVNPSICAGNSLTLTTNAVSGYSWSTGATTSSIVVAPGTNTVYSLAATSSLNCTSNGVISVTVSSGLPVLSISNQSTNICLGQAVTLSASGALTYTWANPGVANGQTFTPSSTSVYTVAGQNGCGISTATTGIVVAPLAVNVLASPTLVCQGYTSTLTAVAAVTGYTWFPGNQTGASTVVAPTANAIYTVSASDGTCAGTATVLVGTKTTPTIVPSTTLVTMCLDEIITLSASGADAGGTYSWSPGNSTTASFTTSPTSSTLFIVSGTNSLNCTSTAQIPVVVNQPAPLTISANRTLTCNGNTVSLTANGSNAYNWINGPATANYIATANSPVTIFTVTGSNTTNTCIATRTIAIAAITPSVNYSSSVAVCSGEAATFTASGASTYTWNGVNTFSSGVYTALIPQSGTIALIANTQSLSTSCPSTLIAQVVVNPLPTITTSLSKVTAICRGTSNTVTAAGAQSYSWNVGTSSAATITVSPNTTTFYSVTGTDANGCSGTQQFQVLVSTCNSISESEGEATVLIFPNPSAGNITIHATMSTTGSICNALGQIIQTFSLNADKKEITFTELSNGIYFIKTETNGQSKTTRIVVER